MRILLTGLLLLAAIWASAQPDTLYITSGDAIYPHAVIYDPIEPSEQYKMIGRYADHPDRIAVTIDHKRGKPSGVYRAYYPDGKPMIFAVYGWGSLHGDWTEYDEFGRITIKGRYRDGLRDGMWAFRKLGITGKYNKGLKHGKWKTYVNGRVADIARYRNGELISGTPVEVP
jgi:antitoxin component YwqK of YwqJK toxin-antitoxin module